MAVQVKVVHADFSKSPAPAIFHERGQPLSVAILKPQGAVAGEHTAEFLSFGWQDIRSSGLSTKTAIVRLR